MLCLICFALFVLSLSCELFFQLCMICVFASMPGVLSFHRAFMYGVEKFMSIWMFIVVFCTIYAVHDDIIEDVDVCLCCVHDSRQMKAGQ